jgi:hypothetical protein
VYNHCNICNIPIYFCNIHLKHLQHTFEISETLETYACNIRFQQNLAVRQAKHCTSGSDCAVMVEKEDGSGRAATRPPVSSCTALGNRAHAVPLASGVRDGGDNNIQVGAASRGEVIVAMRSWGSTLRWYGRDNNGDEGRQEARRR